MATDVLSKINRAHFTLPGWEQENILRDPPRSIHTRKNERIEAGDVNYLIRENQDRVSDSISYYAKGVNPMVSVSYGNYGANKGSHISSAHSTQASLPYKIARNGAFRPPMYKIWQRLPLSRMQRDDTSVQPRPGSTLTAWSRTNTESRIDKDPIRAAIHPIINYPFQPTNMFEASDNAVKIFNSPRIIRPSVSVASGLGSTLPTVTVTDTTKPKTMITREIQDRPITSYMSPVFQVAVMDETSRSLTMLKLPEKEKLRIMSHINANKSIQLPSHVTGTGQPIKLKDYRWSVYTSPVRGMPDTLVLENNEYDLTRNLPLTSVTTNITAQMKYQPEVLAPILDSGRPIVSAYSMPNRIGMADNIFIKDALLKPTIKVSDGYKNGGFVPKFSYMNSNIPDMLESQKSRIEKRARDSFIDKYAVVTE
jgi:hypothetical protein